MPDSPLLDIRNLTIDFVTENGVVQAVKGISLSLKKGETLAVVGESGSGKSVTGLALTRLLPEPPAVYRTGEIIYNGRDVLKLAPKQLRELRGAQKVGFLFSAKVRCAETCHSSCA